MPMKKKIIVIGWTLLGILFASLFAIAVIAVLQGQGAQPWKLVRGGKGGVVFPIELLVVFLVAIVVGAFWIRRRLSANKAAQKSSADEPKK